jgi:hypothetical protein
LLLLLLLLVVVVVLLVLVLLLLLLLLLAVVVVMLLFLHLCWWCCGVRAGSVMMMRHQPLYHFLTRCEGWCMVACTYAAVGVVLRLVGRALHGLFVDGSLCGRERRACLCVFQR